MPTTSSLQLAADLRRRLAVGDLRADTRLVETQLAKEYNVSRIPVREALGTLCAEGLLERRAPHRGVYVPVLSAADLSEIYLARGALETLLYTAAAAQLTSENIGKLEALEREIELAVSAEDLLLLSRANRDFHFEIMKASRMPRIVGIAERLWDVTESYRAYFWADPEHRAFTIQGHREILKACMLRDSAALVAANNRHRQELTSVRWPWISDGVDDH